MEKSVVDITVRMRSIEKVTTTTELKDIDGTFFVKLRGLNIENKFFNTQLPLNEDDDDFYG